MSSKFDFSYKPFNKEKIQAMSEDDLHSGLRKLKRLMREARNTGKDPMPYEVEWCYLDHELQMRHKYNNFSSNRSL